MKACKSWGLEFDAVNENLPQLIELYGIDSRKICADEYWDDKSVMVKYDADNHKHVAVFLKDDEAYKEREYKL